MRADKLAHRQKVADWLGNPHFKIRNCSISRGGAEEYDIYFTKSAGRLHIAISEAVRVWLAATVGGLDRYVGRNGFTSAAVSRFCGIGVALGALSDWQDHAKYVRLLPSLQAIVDFCVAYKYYPEARQAFKAHPEGQPFVLQITDDLQDEILRKARGADGSVRRKANANAQSFKNFVRSLFDRQCISLAVYDLSINEQCFDWDRKVKPFSNLNLLKKYADRFQHMIFDKVGHLMIGRVWSVGYYFAKGYYFRLYIFIGRHDYFSEIKAARYVEGLWRKIVPDGIAVQVYSPSLDRFHLDFENNYLDENARIRREIALEKIVDDFLVMESLLQVSPVNGHRFFGILPTAGIRKQNFYGKDI